MRLLVQRLILAGLLDYVRKQSLAVFLFGGERCERYCTHDQADSIPVESSTQKSLLLNQSSVLSIINITPDDASSSSYNFKYILG